MISRIRNILLISAVAVFALVLPVSCSDNDHDVGDDHHHTEEGRADHDHETGHDGEAVDLDGRKLQVVASTSIVGDVLRSVAGDAADVTVLMGPGQNPHAWSPTPREIAVIEEADLVFVNGLDLEEELMGILESMNGKAVIPVSHGVDILGLDGEGEHDDGHGHDHESGNPHTWFSPLNVMTWTDNIESALSGADPANRADYHASAEEYHHLMEDLDNEIRGLLAPIPDGDRRLVMDHATLTYFARDYGFTIPGNIIPSLTDQAEASARQIAELVEIVREQEIPVIFVGDTAGRGVVNLAQSVAAESGGDVSVVTLLTGALAEEGQRGDSYPDFMRYDAELIAGALSGASE